VPQESSPGKPEAGGYVFVIAVDSRKSGFRRVTAKNVAQMRHSSHGRRQKCGFFEALMQIVGGFPYKIPTMSSEPK
jgi:hypothetical protein